MTRLRRASKGVPAGLLAVALCIPAPASGGALSLGTARGVRMAELSIDGGRTWLSLRGRPLPVMAGARLRTAAAAASVDSSGGSRLDLLPFSALSIEGPTSDERGDAAVPRITARLEYGRLAFRLPPAATVRLVAARTQMEPAVAEPVVGELFADGAGTIAVRAVEGRLAVREPGRGRGTRLVEREPLFLPEGTRATGPVFSSDTPSVPPAGARPAFTPRGESVGYLDADGRLVVRSGFAADLTGPFPERVVRAATARVPPEARRGALVLFDANGGYEGYVTGTAFHSPAPVTAGASGPDRQLRSGAVSESGRKSTSWRWDYTVGLLAVVGTIGGFAAVGIADDDAPATPVSP